MSLSYVKCLSVCGKQSVNTKRCHEYVAVAVEGSFALIMHGNFHPLNSPCLSLTEKTILLDDSVAI